MLTTIGNPYLILGLLLYLFTTVLWVSLLRFLDLKLAYPIMALAFIIVPVLANLFLSEKIEFNTIIGALFIVIGIFISTR
jgi:drug/metabolite transporter (DMT)-like permease